MSTLSLLERDRSNQLARRFAVVATAYFDEPGQARTPAARVPLENLFRMLQMLRYDAFSDERRSGILELESFDEKLGTAAAEDIWHERIERALKTALGDVFGDTPKEQAVGELQSSLTWLATDGPAPDGAVRQRAKTFLERFVAALS